jgi:RNA polymerase sigma-70 factor (ECF subfamily)
MAHIRSVHIRSMADDDQASKRTADHAALIVAVARSGDRQAFADLFQHFAPRIKSMLLRGGAAPEQADEIAQEAMLIVWRKAPLFDPAGASASGWIFRIAHNLRIDAVRRARREAQEPVSLPDEDEPTPDAIVGAGQVAARVRAAIGQLSAEQLQVITLSFFESRPHAEIAKQLNLPLGTVKSRLRLAFRRLRTLLDEVA